MEGVREPFPPLEPSFDGGDHCDVNAFKRLASLFCLLAFGLSAADPASVTGRNWMSAIPDDWKLGRFTIPGTHETCARYESVWDTAKCQTLTLRQQLDIGVRFLDVRCRHINNGFAIHHGMEFQKMSFSEVLQNVQAFLRDNPTETILISVKEEYTPTLNTRTFRETFDAIVAGFPGLFDFRDTVPALGKAGTRDSVRGKVLLVRRFGTPPPFGLDAAARWPYSPVDPFTSGPFRVQDWCWLPDSSLVTFNNKLGRFLALRREAMASTDDGILRLNFASGFDKNWMGIPKSILALSKFMNPRIEHLFTKPDAEGYATRSRGGVVILDYVTEPLARAVFQTALSAVPQTSGTRSIGPSGAGIVDYRMAERFNPSSRDPSFPTLPNTTAYAQPVDFDVEVFPVPELPAPVQYSWTLTPVAGTPVSAVGPRPLVRLTAGTWEARYSATRDGILVDQGAGTIEVRDILIVALGDGHASGEGNPEIDRVYSIRGDPEMTPERFDSSDLSLLSSSEFPAAADILTVKDAVWGRGGDTEATRQNRMAHRSVISAPALYARAVEQVDPHSSVTFISVAQSGATIPSMIESPGNPRNTSAEDGATQLPHQLSHLKSLIGNRPIDELILSAGAQDAGLFARLGQLLSETELSDILDTRARERGVTAANADSIADDVLAEIRSRPTDNAALTNPGRTGVVDRFDDAVATLPGRLGQLAEALRASFTVRRVALTEYPDVTRTRTLGTDGRLVDWWGPVFSDVLPGKTISPTEALVASRLLITPLNRMLRDAAAAQGWTWISGVNDRFRGHGYGAGRLDRWIRTGRESLLEQGSSSAWHDLVLPITTRGMGYPQGAGAAVVAHQIGQLMTRPDLTTRIHRAVTYRGSLLPSGTPIPISLGSAPTEDEFLLTNTGNSPLEIDYATVTGDFRLTRYLHVTLAPGESSTLRVAGLARELGEQDGELQIVFRNAEVAPFTTRISEINTRRIDPRQWMGSLPDNWTLAQFSIPGTHASAARTESIPGAARHQTWTVQEQLEAGIRFLDVGCRLQDGVLRVFQDGVDQGQVFGSVVDVAIAFLKAQPSEALLLMLREESGSNGDFGAALDREITRNPDRWLTGPDLPNLGRLGSATSARGRIVLVRRFATTGMARGVDATRWITGFQGTFRSGPFRVGDVPDMSSLDQEAIDAKWALVQGALNQARFDQILSSLTFANGHVLSSSVGIQAPEVALEINRRLSDFISALPTSELGVVLLDFPSEDLVRAIYQTGFGFQERLRAFVGRDPDAWRETFDADSDRLDDAWELRWFGSLEQTGRDDEDQDGQDNLSEFYGGTSPKDPQDRLTARITANANTGPSVVWSSSVGISYTIQSVDFLDSDSWSDRASGVVGDSFTDPETASSNRCYRVVVEGDPLKGESRRITPP